MLAARLSENPDISVCLLEAGGDGKGVLVRAPIGVVAMLPGRPKINNWALRTEPQPELGGRRGYQPRGRALGGSSAINAMLYTRGHPSDYDDWAEARLRRLVMVRRPALFPARRGQRARAPMPCTGRTAR